MIVLIATSWNSAAGGINAFNIALAKALARLRPGKVACAIVDARKKAGMRTDNGVLLIPVSAGGDPQRPDPECSDEVLSRLRNQGVNEAVEHWIGHDLVTGPAAIHANERHGGRSAVFHHMDYLAYQSFGGGRGSETAANHEAQIDLFSRADLVIGVGARLARTAEELGAARVVTLIPGFPDIAPVTKRKHTHLSTITAGRFDIKAEPVKQIRLAVAAFGCAIGSAGKFVNALSDATMTALGTDGIEHQAELERLVEQEAGRPVKLIAAKFNPDPIIVAKHLSRANLAIMPSRHEGFGLVGWEAIGTGTPLILTSDTGLAEQLKISDVTSEGLAQILRLGTAAEDKEALASAIISVAQDIPRALRKAAVLRDALVSEFGCTWDQAANTLLEALGQQSMQPRLAMLHTPATSVPSTTIDHYPECAELGLAVGQGLRPVRA